MCVVIIAFAFSCSSGSTPQSQVKEIDDLMSKNYPMTSEQTTNLDIYIEEGNRLLDQGKNKEASEAFAKAIDILHMARDAYIYNKAD